MMVSPACPPPTQNAGARSTRDSSEGGFWAPRREAARDAPPPRNCRRGLRAVAAPRTGRGAGVRLTRPTIFAIASLNPVEQRVLQEQVVDRIARERELWQHHKGHAPLVAGANHAENRLGVGHRIGERDARGAGGDARKTVPVDGVEGHFGPGEDADCRSSLQTSAPKALPRAAAEKRSSTRGFQPLCGLIACARATGRGIITAKWSGEVQSHDRHASGTRGDNSLASQGEVRRVDLGAPFAPACFSSPCLLPPPWRGAATSRPRRRLVGVPEDAADVRLRRSLERRFRADLFHGDRPRRRQSFRRRSQSRRAFQCQPRRRPSDRRGAREGGRNARRLLRRRSVRREPQRRRVLSLEFPTRQCSSAPTSPIRR